ncbi:unnamed protein product [Psylliodes chrysocephalus]|uniref:Phorbol-ester/DAG-type domain-containing protein n=1 Tax=Psylliodes chrysocephalus TaxID=3402493 RepID=A0A9P0D0N6_9CUCU|nr:unnamed protein product [Psylliodes chrysocephala]
MGNDANNLEGNKCKRCKKEAKTGLQCVVCGNISHKSCLPSLKNIIYLDGQNINCCSDTIENSTPIVATTSAHDCTIDEMRIKYLEELLVQKDLVISNQKIAINALQGQVNLINKELTTLLNEQTVPKINQNQINTHQIPHLVNNTNYRENISVQSRVEKSSVNRNNSSSHTFTPTAVSSAVHEANAANICNDIIHLNKHTPNLHFKTNQRPKNLLVGTMSDKDQNLKAANIEKMELFHSTNWKPSTTVNDVKQYLINIDPQVEGKLWNSSGVLSMMQSFVGTNYDEKMKLLEQHLIESTKNDFKKRWIASNYNHSRFTKNNEKWLAECLSFPVWAPHKR